MSVSVQVQAQENLVPNPSFEILDSCPINFSSISNALGWYGINISPDYFNRCSPNNRFSVPDNIFGYRNPFNETDNAYCGIITQPSSDSIHEIIGVSLTESLVIGTKYFVSFMVSPSYIITNPPANNMVCFCNKIGAKFYSQPIPESNHFFQVIDNISQVYSNVLINDTTQWYHFQESFIADSAYTFMCIGSFYTSGNMTCECLNTLGFNGYTYIDNVCVSTDSSVCNTSNGNETENENDFEIKIEDEIQQIIVYVRNPSIHIFCEIFDAIGQIVYSKEMSSSENYIDFGNWSSGMYLMRINQKTYKLRLLK